MTPQVANAARIVAQVRERLRSEHGLTDGEDAMEDTLEGLTSLPELLASMAREMQWAKAQEAAVQHIIEANRNKQQRYTDRAEKLRAAISWSLQEAGWPRIPKDALPDMSVSLRDGQRPLIDGLDDEVPSMFLNVKTVTSVKRKELREWLENGGELQTWRLGNASPVLMVR